MNTSLNSLWNGYKNIRHKEIINQKLFSFLFFVIKINNHFCLKKDVTARIVSTFPVFMDSKMTAFAKH